MAFFQRFPYTDDHQLNLNWMLKLWKTLAGGSTGQFLKKRSDKDYDWEWGSGGGGGGTSDYNDLSNKPSINGTVLSGNKTTSQLGISIPSAGTNTPAMDGTGSAGSSSNYSRADHVHPTDTSRAAASAIPVAGTSTPAMDGTGSAGSSSNYSRADHVHPTDTSRAAATSVHSIPAGGSSGQVLAKSSDTDYDVAWVTGGGGGPSPYTSNPAALGTAAPGSSDNYSRGDHVHPMPTASEVGAMSKWVLLWTNPSPSSNFAAQTIAIGTISDYDWIAIKLSNDSGTIFVRNDGEKVNAMVFAYMSGSNIAFRYREITSPSTTGVLFSDCSQAVIGATSYTQTTRNDTTIPLNIWGIKGVQ